MNQSTMQIGFDQRIRLDWLEQASSYALAGMSDEAIRCALDDLLRDQVSVGNSGPGSNRDKSVSIARRIWRQGAGDGHADLRHRGLQLLRQLPRSEHIIIHWGMVLAVYPFCMAIAEMTGRMLGLQGTVATSHVLRRVRERYGDRETAIRAARRVLSSFLDWSVLTRTTRPGLYEAGDPKPIKRIDVTAWLFEAVLRAHRSRRVSFTRLTRSPSLFPFALPSLSCAQVATHSPHLEAIRHGLDQDLLALKQ